MTPGWRRVALATALLVALTAAFWFVWWRYGESTSAAIATMAAAVLTLAVPLTPWALRRWRLASGNTRGQLDELASRLAVTIQQQWDEEANLRQLRDPEPLTVRWREAEAALMDHRDVIDPGPPRYWLSRWLPAKPLFLAGRLDQVVEDFCRLSRRRLVLIGEPGAGKTGVLVLLTLGLLAKWQPEEPVPLLLTVSSWDPEHEAFLDWLPRHMGNEYSFLRGPQSRALVVHGRVLPLLDGLDELPEGSPAMALSALNAVGVQQPMVVACRRREFAQAVQNGDVLTGAAVASLEPIRPEEAGGYLRRTTPNDERLARWEPVFARLRDGNESDAVVAALSTPLMVSLARTVYATDPSADAGELVDRSRFPTREAIEGHLLDALVPALFKAQATQSGAKACRGEMAHGQAWLAFLAKRLQKRRTRDLAWWELGSLGRVAQALRGVGLALGVGIVLGLLNRFSVATGLEFWIMGTLAALVTLAVTRLRPRPARVMWRFDRFLLSRLGLGAALGAALGFLAGLIIGFLLSEEPLFKLDVALTIGLGVAVVGALVGSLGFGLVGGLVRESDRPPAPASTLRSDRTATVLTVAVCGLGTALGVALLSMLGGWLIEVLTQGLGVGTEIWLKYAPLATQLATRLVFGLPAGITIGLGVTAVRRPWPAYQLARAWFALRGQLPWHLMVFLRCAHRLGILRQVGAVYQFRHARLQDRLAGAGITRVAKSSRRRK